jgi:hypothetical protein
MTLVARGAVFGYVFFDGTRMSAHRLRSLRASGADA